MSTKLFFSATNRNRVPILEVLQKIIPDKFGKSDVSVLEIASGTGQHAAFFCQEIPQLIWHPSDIDAKYLDSIEAYREEVNLPAIKKPFHFDVTSDANSWPEVMESQYDMLVAVNLVHISPWNCAEGLFRVAGKLLRTGCVLITYGAYKLHGEIYPQSNVDFDQTLKSQNSEWGLRDVDDLQKEAKKNLITLDAMFDMPSNNKTLVWTKQ